MIENYKYLRRAGNLKCYNEGLFVQAISLNMALKFVPAAKKIQRRHQFNISGQLNPPRYLREFAKHSILIVQFWLREARLSAGQRARIFLEILRVNGRYGSYLAAASGYYAARRAVRSVMEHVATRP